jgi:hypothetical protein
VEDTSKVRCKYLHRIVEYTPKVRCKYLHRGRYLQREGSTSGQVTSRSVEDRSTQSNRRLSPFWPAPLTIPAHCPVRTPTNTTLFRTSFTGRPEYPPQVKLFPPKVSELYLVYRPWMVRGSTTPRGQLLFKGPNKNQGGQKKAKKGTQIAEKVNFSRV